MTFLIGALTFNANAQVDITDDYLANANLSTENSGWTYYSDAYKYQAWRTGSETVSAAVEFYAGWGSLEHTDFKFSQTVTLPAGNYRIAVNAFFREGNSGNGTNNGKAWIFAGEKKQNVYGLNSGELSAWNSAGDDMAKAQAAFFDGSFSNAFDFDMIEETTIELGFQGKFDAIRQWCILGPVRLYKYSIDNYLVEYDAKYAEAQEIVDMPMENDVKTTLIAAMIDRDSFTLVSEVTEAISTLTVAIENAKASIAEFKLFIDRYNEVKSMTKNILAADCIIASDELRSFMTDELETINSNVEQSSSCEEIDNQTQVLISNVKNFLDEAKFKRGGFVDITSLIQNPGMDALDGWQGDIEDDKISILWSDVPMSEAEYYNIDFNIYQTIPDMPKGNYALKVQAFQRPGSNDVAYNNYQAGNNNINTYIYINDGQTTIKNVMSECSETILLPESTIGGNYWPDYAWPNGAGYTPNGMEGAILYFEKGFYDNEVIASIDAGDLTFGLKCDSHADAAWTLFDNFRLYYYGDAIDLTLDENENLRLLSDIENANVTLSLEVKAEEWNALVLPFDVDANTISSIAGEGSEVATLVNQYEDAIIFAPAEEISANTPFLLKATNDVDTWLFDGCYVYKDDEPMQEGELFNFVGNYTNGKVVAAGNYVVDSNELVKSLSDLTIKSYHAYLVPVSDNISNEIVFVTDGLDPKRIDTEDLALLAQVYENNNGDGWIQKWQLDVEPVTARNLPGISVSDGKVTAVNLSNNGLEGSFPSLLLTLPVIESIDLSSNSLSGVVAFTETSNTLKSLNVSGNQLSGNVGVIAQQLPALEALDVSYNRFAVLYPYISENVTTLDISNQTIEGVYEIDLSETNLATLAQSLPSIILYDHSKRDYSRNVGLDGWNGTDFGCSIERGESGLTFSLLSENNNVYMGVNEDIWDITCDDGTKFQAHLSYPMGDSNFNGKFDVADLMTTINFIFEEYKTKPFNFVAANFNNDKIINVQDVVLNVDGLLAQENEENEDSSPRRIQELASTADATLFWRGNDLVLNTTVPVGALDISMVSEGKIDWKLKSAGMSFKSQTNETRHHAVAYSMGGKTLPVGETIIATTSEPADITNIVACDKEAQYVKVVLTDNETTGIETIASESESTGLYDLSGRKVSRLNAKSGIYVMDGKKIIIK